MKNEVQKWFENVKRHPRFDEVGMILLHNGVVRGHSRGGRKVAGLHLRTKRDELSALVLEMSNRPGIIEVKAWVNEGDLQVGDDIMYVLVAGDTRENVFSTMAETVSRIKREIVSETELYL